MKLRTAIREYWQASELLFQARRSGQPEVIVQRKREFALAREHAAAVQDRTAMLVVSEPDGDQEQHFTLEQIKYLIGQKMLYECEMCEEREDYAIDFGGEDHREFHPTNDHTIGCLIRALHAVGFAGEWTLSAVCQECAS